MSADRRAIAHPVHLSASIMCGDLGALREVAARLEEAGLDSIHVDVMDGHFVPNLTFGPDTVRMLREATSLPLHVHMMVEQPERFVHPFSDAGVDVYFFHFEAEPYPARLAALVEDSEMTPGVAVNPFTPLTGVLELSLPYVLVMSVEPGFAGQAWLPNTARRVREAALVLGGASVVGVDGNVNEENGRVARQAGASLFVCGTSSLFGHDDYLTATELLRSELGRDP